MDLNNLKEVWQQHDNRLSQNIRLNEAMLRKTNLNASQREMAKPFKHELWSILVFIIFLPVSAYWIFQYGNNLPFLSCSIVLLLALLYGIGLCYKKLKLLYDIDYYHSDILSLQTKVLQVKKSILQYRKVELMLLPVTFMTSMVLFTKQLHHIDFWDYQSGFIPVIAAGLLISFLGTFLTNKLIYDRKIRNTENLLQELRDYQSEVL